MSQYKNFLLALVALAFAACGSSPAVPDPEPTGPIGGDSLTDDEYVDGPGDGTEVPWDDLSGGELADIIYFDFDSAEVRSSDTDIVRRHAVQLADNPGWRVRLEGHTDERGSREYNIGLGERRAQAVRRLLLIQGASADQISTVSFGEERPQADGSSDYAYDQNRRVVFSYSN